MNDVATFVVLAAALVFGSVLWTLRPVLAGRPAGSRRDRTVLLLLVGVPLAVGLSYVRLGRIDALEPAPADPVRAMAEARTATLAAKLGRSPDDVDGQRLLARSYEKLRRYVEAVAARRRLVVLRPDDPEALVDLADTLSMEQGGSQTGEPLALVRRALAIDAENHRALASLANDAVERNDFATAIAAWTRILDRVPPDSPVARSLRANIARARDTQADAVPADATR